MKTNFSKVTFMDEPRASFDGTDGRTEGWILSNLYEPVAKKKDNKETSVW